MLAILQQIITIEHDCCAISIGQSRQMVRALADREQEKLVNLKLSEISSTSTFWRYENTKMWKML